MKAKIIGYFILFVVFIVYAYFTLWIYVKVRSSSYINSPS